MSSRQIFIIGSALVILGSSLIAIPGLQQSNQFANWFNAGLNRVAKNEKAPAPTDQIELIQAGPERGRSRQAEATPTLK